jgi:hypothetical protein
MKSADRWRWLGLAIVACWTAAARAEQPPRTGSDGKSDQEFVRVVRSDDGTPVRLETAVVRYVPASEPVRGLTVDLIGAVHVADAAYYEQLNRRFADYDAVLYELVAPEGTRVPKGGQPQNRHPVAAAQGGMTSVLKLAHQLEHIDYTRDNLVHADMSPEEFAVSMKERGESFSQMLFRMMGQSLAQQSGVAGGNGQGRLLLALFAPDRALLMKRAMAEQFEGMEGALSIFDGEEGSTLITGRNRKALEVLKRQLDAGRKRVGIFYGAGHMRDFDRRLQDEFQLRRTSTEWLQAWDMQGRK